MERQTLIETGVVFDGQIWQPIRRRWRLVLGGMVLAVLATLIVQATITPKYTASVVLSPSDQSLVPANALSKLSGLASIAGVNLDKGIVTDFEKFQYLVFSDRLGNYQAQRADFLHLIFAKRWDRATRRWIRPHGVAQSLKDVFNPLFGLPAWLPPDGRDIAKLYDAQLAVKKLGETDLIQLNYHDADSARAKIVIEAIVSDTNELLRRDAGLRASRQASYLRQQLQFAAILEYRENLASLLGRQEQTLMLTNSNLPYAADMLQPATVSREPTSQRPYLFAAIAAVIGLSVAAFIAFLLGPPGGRRARRLATAELAAEAAVSV